MIVYWVGLGLVALWFGQAFIRAWWEVYGRSN